MGEDAGERDARSDGLDAAPGLARITVGAWVRTAGWTVGSTARAGRRVARALLQGESVPDLIDDARSGLRGLLGVNEIEERIAKLVSGGDASGEGHDARSPLERQGAELLDRSADVEDAGLMHPAYERILGDLAPDEARMLRLLASDGSQPIVDVRTWRPLDLGSRAVAPRLSMIGRHAGCLYGDRVPAYFNNLSRLGLIFFSGEPVSSRSAYQVLEAQPEVVDAVKEAGRARLVRRSVRLTPFGSDLCEVALPEDAGPPTGERSGIEAEPEPA